jgi:EF hand
MYVPSARSLYAATLGVIATCSLSLPTLADEAPGCQRQATVTEGEGQADGGISASKHAAAASKRFEMMDADKDGRITASEINSSHGAESIIWANHPESPAEKIRALDGNRDGVVTLPEYSAGSQRMFHILDADGNGVLTPSEMTVDPRSR